MERRERKSNPDNRLAEDLEDQFGVNLTEQIKGLLASGEAINISIALEKIQTFLQNAGIELDKYQREILEGILKDNFR